MRIGVFGGTFNPPHLAHLLLAQEAMEKAELDRMIFIPCGNPPHKDSENVLDAKHRFEMTRLSIEDNSCFEISNIEIMDEGKSYTAKTLKKLKEKYPEDTLCFVVGADSLCQMESWYHPEKIFERVEIVAALRGGMDCDEFSKMADMFREKYDAKIKEINMSVVEMSSSEIRMRIKNGMSVRYMLPCKVEEYINKNRLYRE